MIKAPSSSVIEEASKLLKDGNLVAFPTETVYGLGGNAFSDETVEKIFKAKGRPSTDPLIVHGHSADAVRYWANLSSDKIRTRFERASKLWPGPLSVIVPVGPGISNKVTAGLGTVALRVPSHPVALELLKATSLPIAAPSANQFAYVSPTTAKHVEDSLGNLIPLIIDGGKSTIGLESTVIDLTSEVPTILRPGAITEGQLSDALQEKVQSRILSKLEDSGPLLSPGQLSKHYSPTTRLAPLTEASKFSTSKKVGLIRFSSSTPLPSTPIESVVTLSQSGNLDEIASRLYEAIRELDSLGLDLILIDSCNEDGIGKAIMDRIRRATHK